MTTEKFTEPSPRRTVFATTLARLMREPQIDGLGGFGYYTGSPTAERCRRRIRFRWRCW